MTKISHAPSRTHFREIFSRPRPLPQYSAKVTNTEREFRKTTPTFSRFSLDHAHFRPKIPRPRPLFEEFARPRPLFTRFSPTTPPFCEFFARPRPLLTRPRPLFRENTQIFQRPRPLLSPRRWIDWSARADQSIHRRRAPARARETLSPANPGGAVAPTREAPSL